MCVIHKTGLNYVHSVIPFHPLSFTESQQGVHIRNMMEGCMYGLLSICTEFNVMGMLELSPHHFRVIHASTSTSTTCTVTMRGAWIHARYDYVSSILI